MGCFSWKFCNTKNRRLKVGKGGYLLLPSGGYIREECYGGYGMFGGKDVFDLVAEWNRPYLNVGMLICPDPNKYSEKEYYDRAMKRYAMRRNRLLDYTSLKFSDEDMEEKYGKGWKREIGIDIACYDEQNAALPYPIKISSSIKDYYKMPSSDGDDGQGL